MATKRVQKKDRPIELKKPENLDLEKGKLIVEQVIRENQEWLKEMASR